MDEHARTHSLAHTRQSLLNKILQQKRVHDIVNTIMSTGKKVIHGFQSIAKK